MASACSGLDTEKPPCLQAPAVDSKHGGILAPNPARPSYRIQVWCVVMGPSRPVRPQRQLQGTQWAAQRLHLLTSQLCSLDGLQSPLTFPVRNITPATSRPGGPHKLHRQVSIQHHQNYDAKKTQPGEGPTWEVVAESAHSPFKGKENPVTGMLGVIVF